MSTISISRSSLYLVLGFIWLGHFSVDVMIGIWPVYKSLVQLDLTKAGLIVAAGAFIGEGSQLIFGTLSDKGYRKVVIMIGLLAALSSVFLAYSTDYFILFGLYLVTCLGSGAFHPAAAGLVGGLNSNRKALLMTFFASGGSLGLAFSQIIFMGVYEVSAGHTFIMAFPVLVLIFLLFFLRLPQANVKTTHQPHFSDFISFFKRPELCYLYFSQVANQALLWGTIFVLPDVLRSLGHFDWVCYGGGHMCLILGGALMMLPSGYLADRYSARSVLLYSGLIACLAFYFILLFGGISMTVILTALFILGSSLAIANPVAVSLGNRLVPNQPSTISAFLMGLVWCVSEAIGPGGIGIMNYLFNDDDYAPVKALAALGTLFLVNIYATIQLPKIEQDRQVCRSRA